MQFTQVQIAWSTNTFILYLLIILSCYYISIAGRKTVLVLGTSTNYRKELWGVLIPIILVCVKGLGTTGRDLRGGYYINYISAKSLAAFRDYSLEIGYRILNVLVHKFTDKYWVFILIVSIFTIYPVIYIIKKYSDRIDVPVAVLFYVSCFFFSGFSPLRQALSATITLYSFDAIVEGKPYKAFLLTLIASLFHISALVMIFPIIISMLKKINKYFIIFTLLMMFFTAYAGRSYIGNWLAESERYSVYTLSNEINIGFAQIFYYLPIFIMFLLGKKVDENRRFSKISFIYISFGFCCGLIGYIVSIFGRIYLFFVPLVIILAYYSKLCKIRFPQYKTLINCGIIFYCIARFTIYITEHVTMEDLMPYTNIFGWVI